MKNFDGLDPKLTVVASEAEAQLVMANIKANFEKLQAIIAEQEPHIQSLIKAIATTQQLKHANDTINKRIEALMAESEQLIDSPEANSPEVLARRKVIKDEMNSLLDAQDEMRGVMMEVEAAEIMIHNTPPEDLARAEEVLDQAFNKAPDIHPKPNGLN